MDIAELLSTVESVLEMDEQADRSIALDKIRESVTNLGQDIESYEDKVKDLEAANEKLTERNKALFNRVDGRPVSNKDVQGNSHKEELTNAINRGSFFK